jgi:hypothetical protein
MEYKLRVGRFVGFEGSVTAALERAGSDQVPVRLLIDPVEPWRYFFLPSEEEQGQQPQPAGKTQGKVVEGERIRSRRWTRDDFVIIALAAGFPLIILARGRPMFIDYRAAAALFGFVALAICAVRFYRVVRRGKEHLLLGKDRLQFLDRFGEVTFDLPYTTIEDLKVVKPSSGVLPAKRVAVWCTKEGQVNQEGKEQRDWDYMLGDYELPPQAVLEEITKKMEQWRSDAGRSK